LADGIDEVGTALVECDRLVNILKTRIDGFPIEFSTEAEFLNIKQGEFRAKLPLLKGESIPPLPEAKYEFEIDFESKFLSAVNACGSVVEDEKSDSPFQGLLLDFTDEKTFRIAGFSQALLHVARFDIPSTGGFRVAISYRALPLFESLSGDLPMKLEFDRSNNRVLCSSSESSMSVRCVEDRYPKFYPEFLGLHRMSDKVYPVTKLNKDNKVELETPRKTLTFNVQEFVNALGSAACVLGKEDNALSLSTKNKLESGQFIVLLEGLNRFSKAHAVEKLLCESTLDTAFTIGLHYAKIRECLRLFTSDRFTMHVLEKGDPIVLVQEGDGSFVSISVPLRVS
jgi:DNA polymerase III sliding clamp (beta) subunit (PCNA family)